MAGPTVGGLKPVLPVVPRQAPRTPEGDDPAEQFRLTPDPEPTGSFIDSLKGNDAAIEVIVGQGRLLTIKKDIATEEGTGVVAVGDPTIVEFEVLPNPRMLRLTGQRAGVTDLSITTADGETYAFEVHVVYDLTLLRAQLKQIFPDATLRLAQLREHLVVEGQARNTAQVSQILATINAYLASVQTERQIQAVREQLEGEPVLTRPGVGAPMDGSQPPPDAAAPGQPAPPGQPGQPGPPQPPPEAIGERGGRPQIQATFVQPQVINLIRIPGVQQVMLKVRIAELNRTALRRIGADILVANDNGNLAGTRIGGAAVSATGTAGLGGLLGIASTATGQNSTVFGIYPDGDVEFVLAALRTNNLLRILAEPNLVTLSGHRAEFLAGGEFPVPVPQAGGTGAATVTITFKEFGVSLDFLPFVVDDDRIRLSVAPEVSNLDPSIPAVNLPVVGINVPGLSTRRANTTVEMRQGQTLAIAGLLSTQIEGGTARIPGLGDLPYIGPFFSNTSHSRVEKELLVLVTPYLVEAQEPWQVGPLPGDEIMDPNDNELYLMNRIEGRTGRPFRPTVQYEFGSPKDLPHYERQHIHGPVGFSGPHETR